jgi:uncharacterized cofD-like protein
MSGTPAVVALGGGHGLAATLAALRRLTERLTAIVTVADDGGSSGRIRAQLDVLPPGDLRQALAALCRDDEWGQTWAGVLQHRFAGGGELHGHALGNLLIVALTERLGEPVAALDWVGRLLGARGRVLPMSPLPLRIEATVLGGPPAADQPEVPAGPHAVAGTRVISGQHAIAVSDGDVLEVRLVPADPPAVPEALAAVRDADWVVLGPGSWFTSVIPHLLVPRLNQALVDTAARRALVLNLMPQDGETSRLSAADHLRVLAEHAPNLKFDVVIADEGTVEAPERARLSGAAHALGADLVLAPVAASRDQHDPALLAKAFAQLMT